MKKVLVVTDGTLWKVKMDGKQDSLSLTQAEAIKTAKKWVAAMAAGEVSQILIQGKDSKFIAEWTYGKDPYPPKG